MSLDVSLRWEEIEKICHHCKSKYKSHDCVYSSGITHNLWVMADACWIYKALWTPEEVGCKLAKDIIPLLKKWLIKLRSHQKNIWNIVQKDDDGVRMKSLFLLSKTI